MVFASIREHAEHCYFFCEHEQKEKIWFASLRATQKFGEHEQASTRLNFASKSSKGKILRAVKNFNGPFITPILGLRLAKSNNNSACSRRFFKSVNVLKPGLKPPV